MPKKPPLAPVVEKSVGKSVPPGLTPFKPGPDRRRGKGPAPGAPNAGRPPDAWKHRMSAIADRWAQAVETNKVVDNPKHPHFMKAGQFAAEQAHGQAAKRLEVSGDPDAPLVMTVQIVRETKRS